MINHVPDISFESSKSTDFVNIYRGSNLIKKRDILIKSGVLVEQYRKVKEVKDENVAPK